MDTVLDTVIAPTENAAMPATKLGVGDGVRDGDAPSTLTVWTTASDVTVGVTARFVVHADHCVAKLLSDAGTSAALSSAESSSTVMLSASSAA